MLYHLRKLQRKDYTDHENIDDYRELGIFKIDLNEIIIEHQSTSGSMLAMEATYPYFEDNKCWVRFHPLGDDFHYFEKQIDEMESIKNISKYFTWVKGQLHRLTSQYRDGLLQYIKFDYKYQIGDIISIQNDTDDFMIGKIIKGKYIYEKIYNIQLIDLKKGNVCELDDCNTIWVKETQLYLIISAMKCFVKYNNDPASIFAHIMLFIIRQYTEMKSQICVLRKQCDLLSKQKEALKNIAYEMCELMLIEMNIKWCVWMGSRSFVNQYKSSTVKITNNMLKIHMISYLEQEYNLPISIWRERKTSTKTKGLTMCQVESLLSSEAVSNVVDDWIVFIAEPMLEWKKNEFSFKAHICDKNKDKKSIVINGDPEKKRERNKRKRIFWKKQRQFYIKLTFAFIEQNMNTLLPRKTFPRSVVQIVLKYYQMREMGVYQMHLQFLLNSRS